MRTAHCRIWNMVRSTEKFGKCEMHTVGHGIWLTKMKKVENGTQTLYDP